MKKALKDSLILSFIIHSLMSCMTYNRALRKFAHVVTDTVEVRKIVTVTVPRDSAVLRLLTDTTHIVREAQQGRATVRIVREPTYTTVYATCDSAKMAQEIVAKMPRQSVYWGVSLWYKRGFWALLVAISVAAAGYFLAKNFQISKRQTINQPNQNPPTGG